MEREIGMKEVLDIFSAPTKREGKDKVTTPCPVCDQAADKKWHLHVDFARNKFHCFLCGIGGSKAVSLYMQMAGLSDVGEAYRSMRDGLGIQSEHVVLVEKKADPKADFGMVEIEGRHAAYSQLQNKLTLNQNHILALAHRGFTDAEIACSGIVSSPEYPRPVEISKEILNSGIPLQGVPGFYTTQKGNWNLKAPKESCLMIPILNLDHQIQGWCLRANHADAGSKYFALSSAGDTNGTATTNFVGFINTANAPLNKVVITEGHLKGMLASCLSGLPFLTLSGVSAQEPLDEILPELFARGLQEVRLAFDMDRFSNEAVGRNLRKLKDKLEDYRIPYRDCLWNPEFKGIDDFLWESVYKKKRDEHDPQIRSMIQKML